MQPMYLLPFRNKYRDHDFSLITDTIKEYFPVARAKRLSSRAAASSRGFKKMGKIMQAEFHDQKAYRQKWGRLTSDLKEVFNKPVSGFPDLAGGGFVGAVILEEDKKQDFIRQKTLHFFVSVIGSFFSIQGVDSSVAILAIESREPGVEMGYYGAKHAVTVSPAFEFEEAFKKLEDHLRDAFPGYLFVPYSIGMSTVRNISIADEHRDPRMLDTIYEALFGRMAVHECAWRGDKRYGMNDWIKTFNKKEKALIDTLSKHIIASASDDSIHRVWKLQESKPLETFKVSGNVMFGMDVFDVIDLTDKSKAIILSKERGTPSMGKYKIKNGTIEINPHLSLRIVSLSNDSLILHLILDLEHKNVSVKGEALEMKFIPMKKME
jgi:hypothetical protein